FSKKTRSKHLGQLDASPDMPTLFDETWNFSNASEMLANAEKIFKNLLWFSKKTRSKYPGQLDASPDMPALFDETWNFSNASEMLANAEKILRKSLIVFEK
ncbi:hypothetical protein WA026_013076, partial [Henosepilachna vigintioctopunctata]